MFLNNTNPEMMMGEEINNQGEGKSWKVGTNPRRDYTKQATIAPFQCHEIQID